MRNVTPFKSLWSRLEKRNSLCEDCTRSCLGLQLTENLLLKNMLINFVRKLAPKLDRKF